MVVSLFKCLLDTDWGRLYCALNLDWIMCVVRSNITLFYHVPRRYIYTESVSPVPTMTFVISGVWLYPYQLCLKCKPLPLSMAIATDYI